MGQLRRRRIRSGWRDGHLFADSALQKGKYNVIVLDPPWLYQKLPGSKSATNGADGTTDLHYRTMPNERIAALPVGELARPDAHLFMWITNPGVYGGRFSRMTPFEIATAWGFQYKTMLTWVKTTGAGGVHAGGMGWFFRGATEHVLYATKGRAAIPSELRQPNVVMAPKTTHSTKPKAFFDLVEGVCDGPYAELFARAARPGWDVWGDQVPQSSSFQRSPAYVGSNHAGGVGLSG